MSSPSFKFYTSTGILTVFCLMLLASPSMAQLFGNDEKNWERVLIELKKINSRLVTLNTRTIPDLQKQQAGLFHEINTVKSTLPGLGGSLEETRSHVNQQMSQMTSRIESFESRIDSLLTTQAESQKSQLDTLKQDMTVRFDQFKGGLAQDMETLGASNQTAFKAFSDNNHQSLEKAEAAINAQGEKIDQAIGLITKLEETNTKDLKTEFQQVKEALSGQDFKRKALETTLMAGLTGVDDNLKIIDQNTKKLGGVLAAAVKQEETTHTKLDTMDARLGKSDEITRETIAKLKEILDDKLESMNSSQSALSASQMESKKSVDDMGKQVLAMNATNKNIEMKFGKIIDTTEVLVKHSVNVDQKLNQVEAKSDTQLGKLDTADGKVLKLIDILTVIAKEQDKLTQIMSIQEEGLKAQLIAKENTQAILASQQNLKSSLGQQSGVGQSLETFKKESESNRNALAQMMKTSVDQQAGIAQSLETLKMISKSDGEVLLEIVNRQAELKQGIESAGSSNKNQTGAEIQALTQALKQDREQVRNILSSQNELQTALMKEHEKLGQIYAAQGELHRVMLMEQEKIDQLIKRGGGAQVDPAFANNVMQGNERIQEALADLRRKVGVNIARNDAILERLSTPMNR